VTSGIGVKCCRLCTLDVAWIGYKRDPVIHVFGTSRCVGGVYALWELRSDSVGHRMFDVLYVAEHLAVS
jgi:hypothetical protein